MAAAGAYGALERGSGGQSLFHTSEQGRPFFRLLLIAGGAVVAAVVCAAGLAASPRAVSRVEAMADWPAGELGQSALGSVFDGMRSSTPQQMTYGYTNVKTPHYDSFLRKQANFLDNQQNLGLSPALDRARQSQRDMSSLVNYYAQRSPAANPSAYEVHLPPPKLRLMPPRERRILGNVWKVGVRISAVGSQFWALAR